MSSKDLTGYTYGSGGHTEEFYVDSSGVYLGAYPYGINKWDHDWNYIGKIANSPPSRCESMAYNPAENVWYAGGRTRTIYELRDTDNDGSFLDESWKAIFTYPSYGGDHHDGMEYVGGYLWISDMTSDVIGKWQYNSSTGKWEELKRFTYTEPGYVEGMGFGPNDHFWVGSGWGTGSYLYELGNEITKGYPIADAGPDVNNHPPIIPIKFDSSGSHHTDPAKQIVLYEWDFESDGTWDYSGTDLIVEHAYPAYYNPDGSIDWDKTAKAYTATLRVTDNSDPPLQTSDTRIVHITAPPWKPVADPNGPYEGWIGTPVQLDGSKSYDPESTMFPPDHPWYETIAKYEWDFDYDGITFNVDSTEVKPSWTWHSEGKYIVALRVTDSQPSGSGGTIGPLDIDTKYTTVTITKEEEWSFALITDLHIGFGYPDYGAEGFDDRAGGAGQDYYLTDRLTKIVEQIDSTPQIKFVVVLGDISDTAEYSEFLKAREILNGLKVPYIPAIGNHDIWPYTQKPEQTSWYDFRLFSWWDPYLTFNWDPRVLDWDHFNPDSREDKENELKSAQGDKYLNDVFWGEGNAVNIKKINALFDNSFRRQYTEPHILSDTGTLQILHNYVFTYNGVKFIVLDCNRRDKPYTSDARLYEETEEWLRENLEENEPTILLSHQPIMTLGFQFHVEDIHDWSWDFAFSPDDLETIRDVIEESKANVQAAFGGHTHSNFVADPEYHEGIDEEYDVSIPLIGTRRMEIRGAGFSRLDTDVVMTEAVNQDGVRWLEWLEQKLGGHYQKVPFRTATGKNIRIVTMVGDTIEDYERLEGISESDNLPPTSYFTYWPATEKISFKKFSAFPYDPDGNPADCTYAWSFGDGQTASSDRTPWHHYKAGEYKVTLTVTDGGGVSSRAFSRTVVVRKLIEIRLWSPADLIVTDPEGLVLTKDAGEVPGMSYMEFDIYDDGELEDFVGIWERKLGDYLITVIPKPEAMPMDTYTLEVSVDDTIIILALNVQMCNIPNQPYILRLTETEVIPIIPATVDFDPDVLNLKDKGLWVTVYIELPVGHGYDVSMINLTSIMLNGQIWAEAKPIEIGDYDNDGIPDLMVKFNRAAVHAILQVGDNVEITINGKLIDGRLFEGKDIIQVILPP